MGFLQNAEIAASVMFNCSGIGRPGELSLAQLKAAETVLCSHKGVWISMRNSSLKKNRREKKKKTLAFETWTVQSYIASRVRAGHIEVCGQSMIYAFLFDKLINIHLLTILLYTILHQKLLHQEKTMPIPTTVPLFPISE